MRAMKRRSIATAKRWNVPDWRKPDDYPTPLPESDDSDVLQWKWEFLRRDEEYRQDWLRFRALDHPFQLAFNDDPIDDCFDIPKYPKDFPDRHRDVWYVLEKYKLARLLNPSISHSCNLRFYPIPDEGVLIWFDLQGNLKDEMRNARELLEIHQRARRNKLRRNRLPDKRQWPEYLRVLDAYSVGASYAKIGYEVLGVNEKVHGPEVSGSNAESKLRTASTLWQKIPIKLSLPPLG